MSTAIQAAVAAAKARSAQMSAGASANPDNLPATQTPGAVPATAPAVAGRRMGLDDLDNGGMSVDTYLKVKEDGLKVGEKPGLIEKMLVIIDFTKVQVCQVVKYGDPAVYEKTYDGVKTVKGGSWAAAQATAKAADPRSSSDPYMSADIPMVLAEDAKDLKGTVCGEVGLKIGYSLSTTNLPNFRELKDLAVRQGFLNTPVLVELTAEPRVNKKGNKWGVVKFTLVGPVDMPGDEGEDESKAA